MKAARRHQRQFKARNYAKKFLNKKRSSFQRRNRTVKHRARRATKFLSRIRH